MKRREFFEKAGLGSAAFVSLSGMTNAEAANNSQDAHSHKPQSGPLSNAVVSFGQWKTPLNRYPNIPPLPTDNNHQLFPYEATIKAGGGVMFVISGLHQILVYADGTETSDIITTTTVPTTGVPAGVALIDFATNRIYRGPDPSLLPFDRSETVHFPEPGRYLVICGVRNHFVNDNMHGFVRVLP